MGCMLDIALHDISSIGRYLLFNRHLSDLLVPYDLISTFSTLVCQSLQYKMFNAPISFHFFSGNRGLGLWSLDLRPG